MVRAGGCILTLATILAAAGGQEATVRSGPQPAPAGKPPTKVPQSFEAHTFNGPNPERFRCLVCENDLYPTALIFLKDPGDGKDTVHKSLLAKLDELTTKYGAMDAYPEVAAFAVHAVFLSDAAQTSLTRPDEADAKALVQEATARRTLYSRMRDWAKDLKKVVVACATPESVAGYKLDPAAEVTVLYYDTFNILDNAAFAAGKVDDAAVTALVDRIEGRLKEKLAKREEGKKKTRKK